MKIAKAACWLTGVILVTVIVMCVWRKMSNGENDKGNGNSSNDFNDRPPPGDKQILVNERHQPGGYAPDVTFKGMAPPQPPEGIRGLFQDVNSEDSLNTTKIFDTV